MSNIKDQVFIIRDLKNLKEEILYQVDILNQFKDGTLLNKQKLEINK